jgi:hypothetical protein
MSSPKNIDPLRYFAACVYLPEAQNTIPPYTLYMCIRHICSHRQGEGGVELNQRERKGEGQQFTKLDKNIMKKQYD